MVHRVYESGLKTWDSPLDEAVDSVADKIDEGIHAAQAVEDTAAAFMVPEDDLIAEFATVYLCTPRVYEQNLEDDNLS